MLKLAMLAFHMHCETSAMNYYRWSITNILYAQTDKSHVINLTKINFKSTKKMCLKITIGITDRPVFLIFSKLREGEDKSHLGL